LKKKRTGCTAGITTSAGPIARYMSYGRIAGEKRPQIWLAESPMLC
jgi:hypothetical protein